MRLKQYIGVLTGAIYGLLFRFLGGLDFVGDFYSLNSITFIWIVPILIGLIPLLIAQDHINNLWKQFFYPLLSVFTFFILALVTGFEDIVCILIISFPFLIAAGLAGLIVGQLLNHRKRNAIYSILIIPFILNPIETLIHTPSENFEVTSTITINTGKENIWSSIIEVPEITDSEYRQGFFNKIGIPRPIKSTFEIIDGKEYRVGHFSDNLKLVESIELVDYLNSVHFKIIMDMSELRNVPMDRHILRSDFFEFTNISYHLKQTIANETELTLKCNYRIESKMNFYANFWAERVVRDFEERLLTALKIKIEKTNANGG